MSDIVLLCTVGGSHEPIITSIRNRQPAYTCFICSEDDAASGKPGSYTQITGQGKFIKANPKDEKPTLPNIPIQLALPNESFDILQVPPDDLDNTCRAIRQRLCTLRSQFPNYQILADYTGGTKTMTAALVIAALEEGAKLQIVTGARTDLVKIRSGMESVFSAPTEQIRVERALAPFRAAWNRYAYAEAAQGCDSIPLPQDRQLRAEVQIWRDISRAFDAWDRFDHNSALEIIQNYKQRLGPVCSDLLQTLHGLNATESPERREALRLFDLWRNAERRAAQGRYDDAVARTYRLLEWSAQWLLRCHLSIDTANVPPERLPPGFLAQPSQTGKYKLALFQAWQLAGTIAGPIAAFVDNQLRRMQGLIQIRNNSILAHGFTPISKNEWCTFSSWIETGLLPLLCKEAETVKVSQISSQLPTSQCWR